MSHQTTLSGPRDPVSHNLFFAPSLARTTVHSILTRQRLSIPAMPMFEEWLRVCGVFPSASSVSLKGRQGEVPGTHCMLADCVVICPG